MNDMNARFLAKLAERKEKGSLRSLSLFDGMVDFCSNDYLSIAQTTKQTAIFTGSTGSRLISGNSIGAVEAESYLADFFQAEAALVFNSGYDANLGLFSSVPQKGDTVLYDELIHASVRDGIRLSHAKAYSFRHNDLLDLQKKFELVKEGTVFVAVESLYSMDGDFAPLRELTDLCEQNNALLIVDEAHAAGVFGTEGRGLMEQEQLHHRCFARLITFGKAYGTHGAVILGSHQLREYLYNFARSFIYTTALPEAQYHHIVQNVEKTRFSTSRNVLLDKIFLFRTLMKDQHLISDPLSPIQIVPIDSLSHCLMLTQKLQNNQFAVKAILPPTVPEGGQRLRICIHAHNTEAEIESFVQLLLQ